MTARAPFVTPVVQESDAQQADGFQLPIGVLEAEAAAMAENETAIERLHASLRASLAGPRPPFLVRFMDPDARLATVVKAGRALAPSGPVEIRWTFDERGLIVGIEIYDAKRGVE